MQITRRSFAGMCGAIPALASAPLASLAQIQPRTYDIYGVPLRTGSLYPGTENDAIAYRDAGMMEQFRTAGIQAVDRGDVPLPSFLPHHSVPPIRNWPGPRIAWDCVSDRLGDSLQQPGRVPLLIGCDCSIVVGTAQALLRNGARDLHVVYIDGDFDDAAPKADVCNSAASFAVWFLTNPSQFWAGPVLKASQVTVLGWSVPSRAPGQKADSISLAQIRQTGTRECARQVLDRIPSTAEILIHLDIDVLNKREMPAAYFPHEEGLSLAELRDLLRPIARDPRVRAMEISEYASLRDFGLTHVRSILTLLAEVLS